MAMEPPQAFAAVAFPPRVVTAPPFSMLLTPAEIETSLPTSPFPAEM
jgi:hypothetical protein